MWFLVNDNSKTSRSIWRFEFTDYINNSLNKNKKVFSMKQIKHFCPLKWLRKFFKYCSFVCEHKIIKTFQNCQFHDWIILNGFKCFCWERNYKKSTGDYKSTVGNFRAVGNFKIMSLTTSSKFQPMVSLDCLITTLTDLVKPFDYLITNDIFMLCNFVLYNVTLTVSS